MTTTTGFAHVSVNHRDRDGNAGMIESLGSRPTPEEAKSIGESYAISHGADPASLYWKETSPRSWLLMAGQRYTYVCVNLVVLQDPQ